MREFLPVNQNIIRETAEREAKGKPAASFQSHMEKAEELHEKPKEEKQEIVDAPVEVPVMRPFISVSGSEEKMPGELVAFVEQIAQPLIETAEKGITRIEVRVQTESLSEITVTIDHYDTAPHAFNLHFSGNEKAQRLILKFQGELAESLQKALPHFQCNLFVPLFVPSPFRAKNSLVKSKQFGYSPKIKGRTLDNEL